MKTALALSVDLTVPELLIFFSRTEVLPSGCWRWTRAKGVKGYGQLRLDGRNYIAHRLCYSVFRGPIPADSLVMHSCDNPSCVNPNHLSLGSDSDNQSDMERKGRGNRAHGKTHGWAKHPEKAPRGSQHGLSKLLESQVLEIRQIYSQGGISSYELGARYGVSASTIQLIVNLKIWVHV